MSRDHSYYKEHRGGCLGCGSGIGLGNILAAVLSYSTWHSIGWMIIHFIFGWFYVVYFAICHTPQLTVFLDNLRRLITGG